ncbi:MAG: hypothetical protein RLZZ172_1505 [Bacteroidota bacterium]|jgi:uncharacterized protein (DUF1800 family)
MTSERLFQWTPSLEFFTGNWNEASTRHLLKRTQFGATRSSVQQFQSMGLTASLNLLLDDSASMPAPPLKEYNPSAAATPDTLILAGQTWVNDPNNDGTIHSLRRTSFKRWWAGQMINQGNSLREKMTLFWHNHFSTEMNDVGNSQYIYKHHNLLRTHALGNFRNLVKLVTLDPAMLVYLNGQNNNKTAPDENYAREIQELFVIGKGPEAAFTEGDVKAAARILTGWRNNSTTLTSYFDANRHDTGNKQFSAFYGNKLITGKTGATGGEQELNEMLDMLFANNEVALFICRRLYTWFVHYNITPEIESAIIVPMADIFRKNNYEIKPVLRALLGSTHFFDPLNRGCQIKSPVDMLIGFLREMEVKFPGPDQYTTQYGLWNQVINYLNNLQQNPGDPPDVSGWKAYYQEPGFYKYWINTDTLPKRIQYLDTLVTTGYTFSGFKIVVDGAAWVKLCKAPGDPNQLIDDLCEYLLGVNISTSHKGQLKRDILLSGQAEDYYWTTAWDTYVAAPAQTANTKHVTTAITTLIKYLVDLPEYQLC